MAPTGLPAATKSRTNCTASASSRSASGLATPTRQDESVVFVDRRIGDGDVDVERLGPVEVVERLGLPGLRGQQPGGRAGLGHGLPGLGQLDLLDALARDEEGDGLSVEIMCHWNAALLLD